jgi:hypothetical protein
VFYFFAAGTEFLNVSWMSLCKVQGKWLYFVKRDFSLRMAFYGNTASQ